MEKRRMTASERDALVRIDIAHAILIHEPAKLERRLKEIPYSKRDTAMMAKKCADLVSQLLATVPVDQLMMVQRALKTTTLTIGQKRPFQDERDQQEYGLWLSLEVINTLFDACHDNCTMCNLDTTDRRRCKLRKALDMIPNDVADRDNGDCPYYTII